MKRGWALPVIVVLTVVGGLGCGRASLAKLTPGKESMRQIPVADYVDKMKAGWIGQMAGVGWGAPTEFRVQGRRSSRRTRCPQWKPAMVNQFHQDDIYVEMTFLRTLELYGFDVSIRQAGIDFANSGYPLWHANRAGRDNLRSGIAPPDSGHPKFNKHADDIDYQIEADYSGLIAPGMPNVAIELGEKFGRLMNYGDGLYGGQFVGGMYAEAFFEDRPWPRSSRPGCAASPPRASTPSASATSGPLARKPSGRLAEGLATDQREVPAESGATAGSRAAGPRTTFNIDAKINGAYIVMGLLYGKGDPDQTIVIATRCGQDSDCNPSNAGGCSVHHYRIQESA